MEMDPLRMLDPRTVAEAKAAGWADLAVHCNACGRDAHLPWERFRPGVLIAQLPNRLKCQACGAGQPACWPWMDDIDLRRLQRLVRS